MSLSLTLPRAFAPVRSHLPITGPVAGGVLVSLGWPEPGEFDLITALRNRPAVRACFLDSRPLDVEANRKWIAHGMQRPREGLLSIRLGAARAWCGTIGWSGYSTEAQTFEIGRLVVDSEVVRAHHAELPADYPGVAVDASNTLLRFAFERVGLDFVTSVFLSDRPLPRRVNLLAGGRHVGDEERLRPDGSKVRVSCMKLTRDQWTAAQSRATAGAGR